MRDRRRRLKALEGLTADQAEPILVWVDQAEDPGERLAQERANHPRRNLVALRWKTEGRTDPDPGPGGSARLRDQGWGSSLVLDQEVDQAQDHDLHAIASDPGR